MLTDVLNSFSSSKCACSSCKFEIYSDNPHFWYIKWPWKQKSLISAKYLSRTVGSGIAVSGFFMYYMFFCYLCSFHFNFFSLFYVYYVFIAYLEVWFCSHCCLVHVVSVNSCLYFFDVAFCVLIFFFA